MEIIDVYSENDNIT